MTPLPNIPANIGVELDLFLRAIKNKLESTEPIELKTYNVQQLNQLTAKNYANMIVRCTNGDAGDECIAYCNGFAWYVVDLGSKVSIS